MMDFVKKHVDTVVILGGMLSCVLWMNGRFNSVNDNFSEIEKEMAIIKTVLIMKDVMPKELASNNIGCE